MKYQIRLDSLRGLAAVAIVLFHWGVMPFGWLGVPFFFVLSGYLITGILLDKKAAGATMPAYLQEFFRNRVLRLFPLYYGFVLVLTAIYILFRNPPGYLVDAPYLFTYTFNVRSMFPGGGNHGWYGHLWSLAVEWQFYLIWPFVVWYLARRKLLILSAALLVLTPVARGLTAYWVAQMDWSQSTFQNPVAFAVYHAPWSFCDAFAVGALLTVPEVVNVLRKPAWVAAIVAAFAAVSVTVLYFAKAAGLAGYASLGWAPTMPFGQSIWGFSLLNVLFACVIALTLAGGKLFAFADSPLLQHLGKISYGIYVFHGPVVTVLHPKGMWLLPVALIVTILAAHVSYRYFEKRFLRLKRHTAGTGIVAPPTEAPGILATATGTNVTPDILR